VVKAAVAAKAKVTTVKNQKTPAAPAPDRRPTAKARKRARGSQTQKVIVEMVVNGAEPIWPKAINHRQSPQEFVGHINRLAEGHIYRISAGSEIGRWPMKRLA
jgi:hypothetical protein